MNDKEIVYYDDIDGSANFVKCHYGGCKSSASTGSSTKHMHIIDRKECQLKKHKCLTTKKIVWNKCRKVPDNVSRIN